METFQNIEQISKKIWKDYDIYKSDINEKEKMVILDFFPYPSGVGLHVGHALGYVATDIYARFHRAKNKNVLFAMGFDSFGLPAEQYAIETGNHPSVIVNENINNIKKQLDLLALSHDNSRSFNTTDVEYYKWTQWIFVQIFNSYYDEKEKKAKHISELENELISKGLFGQELIDRLNQQRLAYLDEVEVNWCPKLGTVLADEEVINGLSERGNHPVVRKVLKQWMMRITKYSNRLVENLNFLDWPESIKEMQRNWIGISVGAIVKFNIENSSEIVEIYTTRIETISGIAFIAISKEHALAANFYNGFINKYAIYGDKKIPIYIADYVMNYGTSAVMGVPAHDERDYEFAIKNNIQFQPAIVPNDKFLAKYNIDANEYYKNANKYSAYTEKNALDKLYNGNSVQEELNALYASSNIEKKQYTKLRDWIFSRQRYWGEPFPIVYDQENNAYALVDLPIELPHLKIQNQQSDEVCKPLDSLPEWKNVSFIKLDNSNAKIVETNADIYEFEGKAYKVYQGIRETNTMPNWAGSCWYYLRYADPHNKDQLISKQANDYWMKSYKYGSIDLYLGGAEHAVMHLLYARFWHMILYDLNIVSSPEPFQKLFNQGMMLGPIFQNAQGKYYAYKDIKEINGEYFGNDNEKLYESIGKIGKRYKNGVTPEEVCKEYGIDTLRLYIMYLGPLEQSKPWNYKAIQGMKRFLNNVNALAINDNINNEQLYYDFNNMLKKIEQDVEKLKFNTAISQLIIFINKYQVLNKLIYKNLLIILNIFAPHYAEYLYQKNIKEKLSINFELWPQEIQTNYQQQTSTIIIQINGKKKEEMVLQQKFNKEEIEKFAEQYIKNNELIVKKFIIIETKFILINLVV